MTRKNSSLSSRWWQTKGWQHSLLMTGSKFSEASTTGEVERSLPHSGRTGMLAKDKNGIFFFQLQRSGWSSRGWQTRSGWQQSLVSEGGQRSQDQRKQPKDPRRRRSGEKTVGVFSGQEKETRRRNIERTQRICRLVGHREEMDVFLKMRQKRRTWRMTSQNQRRRPKSWAGRRATMPLSVGWERTKATTREVFQVGVRGFVLFRGRPKSRQLLHEFFLQMPRRTGKDKVRMMTSVDRGLRSTWLS